MKSSFARKRTLEYYNGFGPGDEVCWQTINGVAEGTVIRVDEKGCHVSVREGGYMILTTSAAMKAAWEYRRQEPQQYNH